ncbi:MAG: hypothetical protein IT310_11580 [Anaerolineales bacterium]|nr:hypothetical protein [Anaerolineales bacterium]
MTDEYSKELLRSGIINAKSGDRESARRYLDRAVYSATSFAVLAEAWFWMGEILTDPAERKEAYRNCLSHDLSHARAKRALALLEGTLKADELINPDQLPQTSADPRAVEAKRFMCPKCGGRMSFAPDGSQALVCDYCSRNQTLTAGAANEKDFIVAMATLKGHGKPLQEQVFHCKGCGAEFILPPDLISANCAYCNSPHVVSLEKTKDLLAPNGIIPYAFDQQKAIQLLVAWVEKNEISPEKKVELPRGLYLPLWTFDLGGVVDYAAEIVETEDTLFSARRGQRQVRRIQDTFPVLVDDLPLPASRKPSAVFLRLIPTFELKSLQPYDPRFLAGWPAETYDVPMADASLDARSLAYQKTQREIPHALGLNVKLVHSSSANLTVESFKLNLLPVWMTELPFDGRRHLILINGQNGAIASDLSHKTFIPNAEEESRGLLGFLADLLDD